MKPVKNFSLIALMLAIVTLPALAQTNVYSPQNGASVGSPFNLHMDASSCSGGPVVAVGYSLDNSSSTSAWNDWQINGPVGASAGWHTLHVKVWNSWGAVCVTDVSINVGGGGGSSSNTSSGGGGGGGASSIIPWNAVQTSNIQTLGNWNGDHDEGTPGWASGSMSMDGSRRLFSNSFGNFGGYRYWVQFDDNQDSTNFVYDTWLYIANDANGISNLELDMNQTMGNGETVIMGFQCDGWSNSWDFTANGGSPDNSWATWQHSGQYCNIHNWGANQWHHVQIWYSHDYSGWVTYHAVWLDGNEQDINATVFSGFNLGWGPAVVANFQMDSSSNDQTWSNIYMDSFNVYRW